MKTAILIDGDFFLRRYRTLYPESVGNTPKEIVEKLLAGLFDNLSKINRQKIDSCEITEIHRIFFYDCPPLDKDVYNPIIKRSFNLGLSNKAKFRLQLHEELKRQRKVTLRLGRLSDRTEWTIKFDKQKELLTGKSKISDLVEADVKYNIRQKGVDMRIGLDIASLAYKRMVGQIMLIAGDSDFVPAVKLARREGIDFVLDPMHNKINPDLSEHIDGIISCWRKPKSKKDSV
ncbi:MAG: NYN domain-containing protein [Gammaproteobacteria bacterium WSBS_2016_MAG_OTU1]